MSQHRLQIHLNAREPVSFLSLLPVNVIDARGQVLSAGTVTTQRATEFRYERGEAPLFVQLILPNGITETQPLQMPNGEWHNAVVFSIINDAATSDWMAWSTTRLDWTRHGGALLSQPGMKGAWFQLWEKAPASPRWRQIRMEEQLTSLPSSREAIQLELRFALNPRALVVRLDSNTPQVVSLPSERTSVLVTSLRTLSGVVTPRVVVGDYSPDAEAIMEFLRAGKLSPVESMLDPGSELAHRLLHNKVIDPIAATAAAYYLLRKRDWDRLPPQWLDNLANWNEGIPDAKLIRAMSKIERGMSMDSAVKLAVETLGRFLDHGIPIFAEASSLLSDLLALAEKAEEPLDTHTAKTLRMMLASARPTGLSFGFSGKAPDKPMAAHQAFKRRQEVRDGHRLAEAARQMVVLTDFETIRLPPALGNATSSRQLRVAAETLRRGVDVLLTASQRAVTGNSAKTLFLENVLDERS